MVQSEVKKKKKQVVALLVYWKFKYVQMGNGKKQYWFSMFSVTNAIVEKIKKIPLYP